MGLNLNETAPGLAGAIENDKKKARFEELRSKYASQGFLSDPEIWEYRSLGGEYSTTETSGDKQESIQSNLTAGIEPEVPAVNSEDPATINSQSSNLFDNPNQLLDDIERQTSYALMQAGGDYTTKGIEKLKAVNDKMYTTALGRPLANTDQGEGEAGGGDGGGNDQTIPKIDGKLIAKGASAAFDIAGNLFGKQPDRSAGEQMAWTTARQLGKMNPYVGAAVSALESIDKMGATTIKGVDIQQSSADSAFGNSFNSQRQVEDKTIGVFGQMFGAANSQKKKVRKARLKNEQARLLGQQADDWRSLGNDLSNLTRREAQLNGYLNDTPYGALRAKEGDKILLNFKFEKHHPDFEFKKGGPLKLEFSYKKASDSIDQESLELQKLQNGGSFNVIPEGALHARKHNMEIANEENITKKGIPVVSENENGELEQQAEIELNEIIFRKEVTERIEKLWKEYEESKDDDLAIQAGKILVKEILYNTQDRTGLISNII